MGELFSVMNSDCLDAMRKMNDGSIDAIVTDPPYGLAFMGAKWDSFNGRNGRQTTEERQAEGRRYADENKGAPRYGNSHGKKVTRGEMLAFQESMTPIFAEALRVTKCGGYMLCFGGTRTFHRLACAIEDAGWTIRDTIMWVYGSGFPHGMDVSKAIDKALGAKRRVVGEHPNPAGNKAGGNSLNLSVTGMPDKAYVTEPATDEAKAWDGWNTQLKPAWEPVIVAQKPLDGTVAHNVMTHGVGAMNIDGCRVPTSDTNGQKMGRFPANLVHDGSQEVLELFPDTGKSSGGGMHTKGTAGNSSTNAYGSYTSGTAAKRVGVGDSGSTARFFYCAKASKRDRGEGNDHPTIKPNALMRYLVRLVCPQGGTVLDPFMGSGSTGVACIQEGMRFVGIDMDEHYCDIATRRIESAKRCSE